MEAPSEDSASGRERLERWADAQRRVLKTEGESHRWPARAIERLGLGATGARRRIRLVFRRGLKRVDRVLDHAANRLFDRGLGTAGYIHLPEHDNRERVPYLASPWHVLPRALRYCGVSESDTFVDFGCGKGRVVHQAARRPFRRVLGVELSAELAETARAVLAARRHQHRARDVEIIVADVTQFEVPDDLTFGYLFRPFGDETVRLLLRKIVESIDRNPRRVRLIYVWPEDSLATVLETGRFRLVKEQSTSLFHRGIDRVAIFESVSPRSVAPTEGPPAG